MPIKKSVTYDFIIKLVNNKTQYLDKDVLNKGTFMSLIDKHCLEIIFAKFIRAFAFLNFDLVNIFPETHTIGILRILLSYKKYKTSN